MYSREGGEMQVASVKLVFTCSRNLWVREREKLHTTCTKQYLKRRVAVKTSQVFHLLAQFIFHSTANCPIDFVFSFSKKRDLSKSALQELIYLSAPWEYLVDGLLTCVDVFLVSSAITCHLCYLIPRNSAQVQAAQLFHRSSDTHCLQRQQEEEEEKNKIKESPWKQLNCSAVWSSLTCLFIYLPFIDLNFKKVNKCPNNSHHYRHTCIHLHIVTVNRQW